MSRLDELIQKLCPNGVEYRKLGELGKFFGGITGKSKDDFTDGNAKFITYKNVYDNPSLQIDVEERVKIADGEKQRTLQYGDVIFTGSSETPDECGMSSVVTVKTEENLYLNSFCFFFRFDDMNIMLPGFAKHLFRSNELRYQIGKTANGVTRYNISKKMMEKVSIPVPPLEVQREIVRILDSFTLLTAELTAELTARKKQYEFYRNELLENLCANGVEYKTIQEVCVNICSGGTPKTSISEYYGGDIPWVRTQEVDWNYIYDTDVKITEEGLANSSAKWIPANCIIVAMYGATAAKVTINKIPVTTNQACCNLEINENIVLIRYVYHFLCNEYENLKGMGQGSQSNINAQMIKNYRLPVPTLEVQREIVDILDRFDSLCNDISTGLPAEIEARQKQYEFYRDKLLSFKQL